MPGFRFCGMMLLTPVRDRSSSSHGTGSWYWMWTSSMSWPIDRAEIARVDATSVFESTDETWLAS